MWETFFFVKESTIDEQTIKSPFEILLLICTQIWKTKKLSLEIEDSSVSSNIYLKQHPPPPLVHFNHHLFPIKTATHSLLTRFTPHLTTRFLQFSNPNISSFNCHYYGIENTISVVDVRNNIGIALQPPTPTIIWPIRIRKGVQ